MANIDKQEFLWNWKLKWDVNKIYTDLINVDVVKPPYSWYPRNTSFFLQTRLWYIAYDKIQEYIEDNTSWWLNFKVTDVEIIRKDNCKSRQWIAWVVVYDEDMENVMVLVAPVKEDSQWHPCVQWCFSNLFWEEIFGVDSDRCFDYKIFKTNAPMWELPITSTIEWWGWTPVGWANGIQENRLEWWVYRWYFTVDNILESHWEIHWASWLIWKYITVTSTLSANLSSNWDSSQDWFAWQTRMITWYTNDMQYLVLDNAWDWFRADEPNPQWKNCTWSIFKEEWETFWLSQWPSIMIADIPELYDIAYDYDCDDDIEWNITSFFPTQWDIISTVESNGRLFSLYKNWWVRYSTVWWRDKFFYDDELYVWEDKFVLCSFKDCVIAFGRNKISVLVPEEFENNIYFRAYEQSATIWLKSRYSFWEHDWNLVFVSNDNRLFTIGILETSGKYMLWFTDIGEEIINSKLWLMYDSDEVFIWDYWNDLKIIVQSKPNPSKPNSNNSETHIYKFDSIFKVWTEDHLENILIGWYKHWVYFWTWWLYIRWLVERDWSSYDISNNWRDWIAMDFRIAPDLIDSISASSSYKTPNRVVANITAFMTENETNWISYAYNWSSTWAPDLFSMIKLNRLAVTLWYWKYSEQTKIKITAYREWIWEVTTIPIPTTNAWIEMVTGSYLQKPVNPDILETKRCLLETIGEWQTKYIQDWEFVERKIEDLVTETPRCDSTKRVNYQDHNIDIDSSIYELAPHKPIVIWWLSDTQHYSSQVKVEVISESWDILNFGWILAELYIAPNFFQWADWENLIEMGSC